MRRAAAVLAFTIALVFSTGAVASADEPTPDDLIRAAIPALLGAQDERGEWPYEGVYRVRGEIPAGYRIGGTALAIEALLAAAPGGDEKIAAAMDRGLRAIVPLLDEPDMAPSRDDRYDVRVWGHACALELFCQLRAKGRLGAQGPLIEAWIPKLVRALLVEEIERAGGWNYANRRAHASFVTAAVTQALLLARSQGETVPDAALDRAAAILAASRHISGFFAYGGALPARARESEATAAEMPGAAARAAICEATLHLLGAGSPEAIARALDAFHEHWGELEKRRRKTGTHEGRYSIAPYYFYFGHRYAGQAIEMLPTEEARARERKRLLAAVLRTRDADGTWNDRVFPRSRAYGTAMVVLALLGDRQPLPPARSVKAKRGSF